MAYNGSDIYQRMNAKPQKTARLDAASGAAKDLADAHQELADAIKKIQTTIDGYWEGPSADAAKYSLGPVIQASDDAATNLQHVNRTFSDQSSAFHTTHNALRPMEGGEPDVSWYQKGIWWESDAEEGQRQWNENNRHNIEQYKTYDTTSRATMSTVPTAYPSLNESFGGVPLATGGTAGVDGRSTGTPSVGGTGGGLTSASGYSGPGGVSATPSVNAPAAAYGGSGGVGAGSGGQYTTPAGYGSGATSPTTYGAVPGGAGAYGPSGAGAYGAGGFGPGSRGSRSSTDYNAGAGGAFAPIGGAAGGGYGPTGGGAGGSGAGGAGQGPGAGSRVGMGPAGTGGGMSAAPGGAAAAAAAGGRGGMGGGMMGGAGAGRGQGGEDADHQRKYGVDSDEWFTPERDEDGGVLRDPVTGMPVVPPVIGE